MHSRVLWSIAACGLLWSPAPQAANDDDDDKPAGPVQAGSQITLTPEQWHAIGIEIVHPRAATLPERIEVPGFVLDPTSLVADAEDVATATAGERATHAEFKRLTALAQEDSGVSGKMLEAATSEEAKFDAQLRLANARFAQRWAPLMRLHASERDALIGSVESGRQLLLRAEWPGRQSISTLPDSAQVNVDGVNAKARVLGVLSSESATKNAAVLILVPRAPPGIPTGAHLPVSLGLTMHRGFLIPNAAISYDEKGAYVFKQLVAKPNQNLRYVRVDVKLLLPNENRWLVDGAVDDDDDIVIAGVGALWSLESLHDRGAADDDDD
jgi:hypothetical protein